MGTVVRKAVDLVDDDNYFVVFVVLFYDCHRDI